MNCGTMIDDLMTMVARAEEHTRDTHCELAALPLAMRVSPVFEVLAQPAGDTAVFFVPPASEMAMIGVA